MMASPAPAAHRPSAFPSLKLHSFNGLRYYYKVRNFQIVGGRNRRSTMSATSVKSSDQCPDTSKWLSADCRNTEYIHAVHVAEAVSTKLSKIYPILQHGKQDFNATDGPSANVYANVVKYMIQSSKNLQDKKYYYLKIEVDAKAPRQFKYIIARVVETPEHQPILCQTWTTST